MNKIRDFFKSKLNIVITTMFGLFIVCATLSYVHQVFVYIAMFFAGCGLFAIGLKINLQYKKLKYNLREELNTASKKSKKRMLKLKNLTPLKLQFISLYIISFIIMAYSVLQIIALYFTN